MKVWATVYHNDEYNDVSTVNLFIDKEEALTQVGMFLKDVVKDARNKDYAGSLKPERSTEITFLLCQQKIEEALEKWNDRINDVGYYVGERLFLEEYKVH